MKRNILYKQKVGLEIPKEIYHPEALGVDERIILNYILKKLYM
jgi:hypothetical protein